MAQDTLGAEALELEEEEHAPPLPTEVNDAKGPPQLHIDIDEDEQPFQEEEILDTD